MMDAGWKYGLVCGDGMGRDSGKLNSVRKTKYKPESFRITVR